MDSEVMNNIYFEYDKVTVLINYTSKRGGGALDSYEMAKAFHNLGCKVIAIISNKVENIEYWRELGLYRLIEIETYNSLLEFAYRTIAFSVKQKKVIEKELCNEKIDFIYAPMGSPWMYLINRIIPNVPFGLVLHDPIEHSGEETGLIKRFLKKIILREKSPDEMFVHTEQFREYVAENYHMRGHVSYIPLGRHNMYRFCKNKKKIVTYGEDSINFLFFGRISKYKGIDVLIEAFAMLQEDIAKKRFQNPELPEVTLTIVGDGDFSRYEALCNEIDNILVINRWIKNEEVESVFLGNNLINVCAYKDATQSGVVMVAYDYGLPVIATDTGGLSEQVIDGQTGLLISECEIIMLKNAMEYFVINRDEINRMKMNIKSFLVEKDWQVAAKLVIDKMVR